MTMRDRHLHHITLQTGHVRRSPRDEVRDDVVARLQSLIRRALTGEHQPVPGQPGYTLTGGVQGRCCALTLWGRTPVSGGRVSPQPVPILTVGIAPHSRCGAQLWRHLHARTDLRYTTDADHVPPEPWCADRLELGAALDLGALGWTGDLARCLAWAWIEMREGDDDGPS